MAAVSSNSSSRRRSKKIIRRNQENKMKQKNFPPNPPKIIGRFFKNQFVLVLKILIVGFLSGILHLFLVFAAFCYCPFC